MRQTGERGFALVSVLAIVLLLALMVGSLVQIARAQARTVKATEQRLKASLAADAAIYRTILALSDKRLSGRWGYGGEPRVEAFYGSEASIAITDENSLIDLNTGNEPLLSSLFKAAGLDAQAASRLVDSVRDWTDEDDLRRLNGAELDTYRASSLPYGPRNGPLESTEELLLIQGMTQPIHDLIESAVTVYSGRTTVDPGRSRGLVRQALGLEKPAEPADTRPVLEALGGRAFRILVTVSGGDSPPSTREAVIRYTDDLQNPYWLLKWRTIGPMQDH